MIQNIATTKLAPVVATRHPEERWVRFKSRAYRRHVARRSPALNQQQTAAYISDVALGLRAMADKAGMPFLTYLLDMAVHEAMQQSELPRRRRTDRP